MCVCRCVCVCVCLSSIHHEVCNKMINVHLSIIFQSSIRCQVYKMISSHLSIIFLSSIHCQVDNEIISLNLSIISLSGSHRQHGKDGGLPALL